MVLKYSESSQANQTQEKRFGRVEAKGARSVGLLLQVRLAKGHKAEPSSPQNEGEEVEDGKS